MITYFTLLNVITTSNVNKILILFPSIWKDYIEQKTSFFIAFRQNVIHLLLS